MQTVDDEIETIHLYVVKEEAKKPPLLLPLFAALVCLSAIVGVTIYSAYNPSYVHETLRIPAHFLPLQTITTTQPIIPKGVKTYPATTAHGILTITNGSVVSQELPQGLIFTGNGIEVLTTTSVFVPAGSAEGFGIATVSAKAVVSGVSGNIQPLSINAVYGTSLYVRNLDNFTGGKESYSVKVVTPQNKQTALDAARVSLTAQVAHRQAILANPCKESAQENHALFLTWTCQFIAYPKLVGVKITTVHVVGKSLLVDVVYVARPHRMIVR